MPRPKAATVPRLDPLAEIRQLRARQAALQDDLRAKRERLLAEVGEIDEALADLGGVGARAVAALVPKPAQVPSAPRQPKAAPAPRAPVSKGIRAGDPVAAELVELLPWIDALKNDRQRQAIRLRAGGMSPAAVAAKLGCSNKDVGNDVMRGRKSMREARSKGKPGETPASDDEPAPAPAPPVNDNAATVSSEPPQQPAARVPTGWDRSDPDEDFADIAPAVIPADPAHVHLWSPESGGAPACTLAYDPAARTTTDRGEATCPTCLATPEPEVAGTDQRAPEWVLGWLSPEIRRAYQGVALEGLSCQTMAWTEDVTANVISGRVNGARQKVKRLLRWESDREAEGKPLADTDREAPPVYRDQVDPLLAILQRPEGEMAPAADDGDDREAIPTLERARASLTAKDNGCMRAHTISAPRLSRAERRAGEELDYPADVQRPITRGDCLEGPRPCPFVSCKHHLYLDVNPESGTIKLNFPHLEVGQMAETCALDVADRGGITLEEVGAILNLTRERIRQIEVRGLDTIRDSDDFEEASERRGSPLAEAIEG